MIVVTIHEAKTNFSKFGDRVHGGEEVLVAKAGSPGPAWFRWKLSQNGFPVAIETALERAFMTPSRQ